MGSTLGEMQSLASNIFSAYASVAASMMLFRSIAHESVPEPIKNFFYTTFGNFFKHLFGRFFSNDITLMTLVIDENSGISRNQIYDAAEIYLRSRINPKAERLKANKSHKQKEITLSMEKGEQVMDTYKDFQLKWQFILVEPEGEKNRGFQSDKRYFELTFDTIYKDIVVNDYLPFILLKAKEFKEKDRDVKLYTRDCIYNNDDDDYGNGGGVWGCVNLDHPVTFEKLAMEPEFKKSIIDDLDRFVRRKDYYKKVGKAWKRGYLLYGPPGTGKSSLIAAMANYLKFDVYDLELSSLYSNSELRRVLLSTNNKSIIVIEDIDCSSQTLNRDADSDSDNTDQPPDTKLTLSGLLNFMDGLWSTCGDERIVVFTTNHREKLDPALLRPGRMDMHIHMGYCTSDGFDVLVANYLGVNDHRRFPEIKGMIKEVDITPAEIAEHLMRNEDVDLALEGVLDLLEQKKNDKKYKDEAKEKEAKSDEAKQKETGTGEAKENGMTKGGENVESEEKEKKRIFAKFLRSFTRSRRRSSKISKELL